MSLMNDRLEPGVTAINMAIRKTFLERGVKVDDITWNPHRGGLVNDRFSIHSVQITVRNWQKTFYRISLQDILDSASGLQVLNISRSIEELADQYREFLESGDMALGF